MTRWAVKQILVKKLLHYHTAQYESERPEKGELDGVTEDGGQDEDVVDEEPGGEGGHSLGQLHTLVIINTKRRQV